MEPSTAGENVSLLMIGVDEAFLSVGRAAANLVFPGAGIDVAGSVREAVDRKTTGACELLVLDQPAAAELTAARMAADTREFPRWTIVLRGEVSPDEEVLAVAEEDWNPRLVARVFRAAVQQQRLRHELARCRGDLLTIGTRVTHDLRSPLGGVLTTAGVLKEILAEEVPLRVPLADGIIESAEGLMKLTRQLSLVAKASSHAKPLTALNMQEPFDAAFQHCERQLRLKGATLAQPSAWPEVMGNATWLETIWYNLLVESLEHAGPQPRIEAGWEQAGELRFWVRDQGTVPVPQRSTLFYPFHLLHHPNAPRGFGLPLVQRLVALQDGRCGYAPLPEGGSIFFFTLRSAATSPERRSGKTSPT